MTQSFYSHSRNDFGIFKVAVRQSVTLNSGLACRNKNDKITSLMVSKSLDKFNFVCENNESRSAAGTLSDNRFPFFVPSFRPCWQSIRGCSESLWRLFKSGASGGNFQLFASVVNLYIQTQLRRSILLHIPVQWRSASLWICFLILNRQMSSN